LKQPDWILYTANGVYLVVVIAIFANRMMVIEEFDNETNFDLLP
jgi:hypothetical protein